MQVTMQPDDKGNSGSSSSFIYERFGCFVRKGFWGPCLETASHSMFLLNLYVYLGLCIRWTRFGCIKKKVFLFSNASPEVSTLVQG